MSIYDTLNKEQKEAVLQTEGPVLILAGAGSGKTRVITHRIAYLMDECGVNPWNILAITFTNKAAGEMRDRVDKLIGFGSESIWISTFHSMCVRMLRRYADRIGYDNSFAIYDTDDQKQLMKDVYRKLGLDNQDIAPRAVLSAISSAKNELISPNGYKEQNGSDYRSRIIGDAYEEYQRLLRANNAMDFDDLLMMTVILFQNDESVLKGYQDRFHYIMVDEYQDTNSAQFELIRLLSGARHNLCVVGDDDQSIYKFRGANIRNILDFEKLYPDAKVIKLEQNYRSTGNVLEAANAVIAHNSNRKPKHLWCDQGEGSKLHFRRFNTGPEEASFIAQDIERRMRQDPRLSYKDFAVLYRTNAQSRLLEERFLLLSIPYDLVGGTNFYERREIRDILSYLKTIDNGVDDLAVRRILNVPKRGIGQTSIDRIQSFADEGGISFYEALKRSADIPSIGRAKARIDEFTALIEKLRAGTAGSGTQSLKDLIDGIVSAIDYEGFLKETYEEDAEDRIANIGELINKAVSYEDNIYSMSDASETGTGLLTGFLEEVALIADIDEVGDSDDKVLLMTLHSAKGLEFRNVYMAGMEEGLFPSQMSIDTPDDEGIEEERRLAYVGITRAREDLTLTYALSRMVHGEVRYSPVSRFLLEIPEDLLDESIRVTGGGYADEEPRRGSRESRAYSEWDDDYSFGGGSRYGGSGSRGGYGGYGSRDSSYGSSYGNDEAPAQPARRDSRLKAIYVKPHTAEDKKPFIARSSSAGFAGTAGRSGKGSAGAISKGQPAPKQLPDYGPGDRVSHIKFGTGTVISVEENPRDYKVTVNFDEAGQKVMYAAFARLEKI